MQSAAAIVTMMTFVARVTPDMALIGGGSVQNDIEQQNMKTAAATTPHVLSPPQTQP